MIRQLLKTADPYAQQAESSMNKNKGARHQHHHLGDDKKKTRFIQSKTLPWRALINHKVYKRNLGGQATSPRKKKPCTRQGRGGRKYTVSPSRLQPWCFVYSIRWASLLSKVIMAAERGCVCAVVSLTESWAGLSFLRTGSSDRHSQPLYHEPLLKSDTQQSVCKINGGVTCFTEMLLYGNNLISLRKSVILVSPSCSSHISSAKLAWELSSTQMPGAAPSLRIHSKVMCIKK